MILRSVVRDCLFLNWALPVEALPEPPCPLRYQVHSWQGRDYVFASALLFFNEEFRLPLLPLIRLSYPQFNFRFCTLDGDGVPSVLFHTILVPLWVVPGARLVAKQPAARARFRYPRPSRRPPARPWRWTVISQEALEVSAQEESPGVGPGPRFPSWEETVEYMRQRPRGYAQGPWGLRKIETSHPAVDIWPLRAQVEKADLLLRTLPGLPSWPELHSAWLCPEIPFVFELARAPRPVLAKGVPRPVTSHRARL